MAIDNILEKDFLAQKSILEQMKLYGSSAELIENQISVIADIEKQIKEPSL